MMLSAQMSECGFFSVNSHESKWQPTLTLDGQPLRYNATPKFHGATYARQLTFSRLAALVDNSLCRQAGALRKLASTSWGYYCQTLRATYIATGRSKLEYGASSLMLWISNSTLRNVERSQRYTGRAITGQLRTTHVEVFLAEVDLYSILTRAIQLSTIATEKSLRTTLINPRQATAIQRVWQRIQRNSCHMKAGDIRRKNFGDTKPTTTPPLQPPWTDTGTHTYE